MNPHSNYLFAGQKPHWSKTMNKPAEIHDFPAMKRGDDVETVRSLVAMAETYVAHFDQCLEASHGEPASDNETINSLALDAIMRARRCRESWNAQLHFARSVLTHLEADAMEASDEA